jgi:hypothetical protein
MQDGKPLLASWFTILQMVFYRSDYEPDISFMDNACLPVGTTALGEPWPPLQPVHLVLGFWTKLLFTGWGC